jgi:antitoxin (DNA-binding transcriptional repressor) of toxin-antitoxin stability system
MREVNVEKADLWACISRAQRERLVITRRGKPIALLVGVRGMDPGQLELGSSDRFWKLIAKRRKQKSISRTLLEQRLDNGKQDRRKTA